MCINTRNNHLNMVYFYIEIVIGMRLFRVKLFSLLTVLSKMNCKLFLYNILPLQWRMFSTVLATQ